MTLLSLFAPVLIAGLVALTATAAHRRLPPPLAARFVACALAVIVVAALPTLVLVAFAFLAHVPLLGSGIEWCAQAIGFHDAIPAWLGAPAASLVGIGAVRAGRVLRDRHRLRCDHAAPVEVVRDPVPLAITLPGRGGKIVLSQGLLDLLHPTEIRIVLAHEHAHARHRHDRYLLTAELAAALLPPLRSFSSRLLFSIERWADEVAARACGDRRLVAHTLGKVALHTAQPVGVTGFAGLGVIERVEALLEPPRRRPTQPIITGLWVSLAVTALLSAYQLHHLHHLIGALCPH